jgi:hypothetical protein
MPTSVVQVAGFPDAYAIRRGGPAEAIINRGRNGDWYVLFGHRPDAEHGHDWRHSATLSGNLDQVQAAAAAVDLIEAAGRGSAYAELFARLIDVGGAVAHLGRLHAPDTYGNCMGDNIADDDPHAWPWNECKTVQILAATVGYELVGATSTC